MAKDRIIEQSAPAALAEPEPLEYPDSDGLPMAENDEHHVAIQSVRLPLEEHLRHKAGTYVTGDLLMYYVQGDPSKCVAPDVMVVQGVASGPRRSYLVWAEGKPPDFVVEVSSPDSGKVDRTVKRELYASIGVQEYLLFDPGYEEGGRVGRVQLFRRRGSKLLETGPGGPEGSDAELESEVLRVSFRAEGMRVRVRALASGKDLLWANEQALALQDSERQRNMEAQARQDAERQRSVEAQARQDAERQRSVDAQARQDAERQRDVEAQARQDAERRCAAAIEAQKATEARIAELEALLRDSKRP